MPKIDSNQTNEPTRRTEPSRDEAASTSGTIGPAPIVPSHREALREARSLVTRPYAPTAGLLQRSFQRLTARGRREIQESSESPNQEPQPPLEWTHSRVRVIGVPGPSDVHSSAVNNPSVCTNFALLTVSLILALEIHYQASYSSSRYR